MVPTLGTLAPQICTRKKEPQECLAWETNAAVVQGSVPKCYKKPVITFLEGSHAVLFIPRHGEKPAV